MIDNPLFYELSKGEMDKLMSICEEKVFEKDEVVFLKDDSASDLYLIVEGECEVKTALGGREEHYTLSRMKAGEIFGEIGFLEFSKRTATVRCAKPTKTLVLNRRAFDNFVMKNPDIGMIIFKNFALMLTRRLRNMDEQLKNFYLDTRVSFGKLFK